MQYRYLFTSLSCLSPIACAFLSLACAADTSLSAPAWSIQPLFDHPLRDAAICRAPDGVYYLTGTSGTEQAGSSVDFETNDGIWLWKSDDLETWEPLGQVWSIGRDPQRFGSAHYGNPSMWQLYWRASKHSGREDPVRGMTSPEIHAIRDNFYITYSMNGYGTGLLVSESGEARGPYKDLGKITRFGAEASMFEDTDGEVYWVWDEGWIARMNDELNGLAEEPRLLTIKPAVGGGSWPQRIGTGGAFLFRAPNPGMEDGEYHLIGTETLGRMGPVPVRDTYIASAQSIYGPYQRRDVLVPHGGQSTVFQGPDGSYFATFNGSDPWAAVRDRPAIVPLVPHATEFGADFWWCGAFTKPWYPVTEGGAWGQIEPLLEEGILRDIYVLNAPDGYYYMTATDMALNRRNPGRAPREQFGIEVWRSKDLANWESIGLVWHLDDDPETRSVLDRVIAANRYGPVIYDPEIHYLKDTFWLVASLQGEARWSAPGGTTIVVLKSISGQVEGPYEQVWEGPHTGELWTPSLFEDDDGEVYMIGGGIGNNFVKLNDALTGTDGPIRQIFPADNHKLGEGGHIVKVGDRYIHTTAVWHGADPYDKAMTPRGRLFSTYDLMASSATSLDGPWSRTWCIAPKCGNSRPFQDKEGNWWATFFGNHFYGPWRELPGIYPLVLDAADPEAPLQPRMTPLPVEANPFADNE